MIEVDGRDHGEQRPHHVGGVQAPAQPDLQHHPVHGFFGEDQERHRGDGFEISGVQIDGVASQQFFDHGVDAVEGDGEPLGGNGKPADADALGGLGEMRRSVESRAQAGGAEAGFDHGTGRAFAIRAGHVDDREAILRIAERGQHGVDALQAELGSLDFVAQRVKEMDRIGVVHCWQKKSSAREM